MASPAPLARSFGAAAASRAARRAISAASAAGLGRRLRQGQANRSLESLPSRRDPAAPVRRHGRRRREFGRPAAEPAPASATDGRATRSASQKASSSASGRTARTSARIVAAAKGAGVDPSASIRAGSAASSALQAVPSSSATVLKAVLVEVGPSLGEPPPGGEDAAGRAGIGRPAGADARRRAGPPHPRGGRGGARRRRRLSGRGAGARRRPRAARTRTRLSRQFKAAPARKAASAVVATGPRGDRPAGHGRRRGGERERFGESNHARQGYPRRALCAIKMHAIRTARRAHIDVR